MSTRKSKKPSGKPINTTCPLCKREMTRFDLRGTYRGYRFIAILTCVCDNVFIWSGKLLDTNKIDKITKQRV